MMLGLGAETVSVCFPYPTLLRFLFVFLLPLKASPLLSNNHEAVESSFTAMACAVAAFAAAAAASRALTDCSVDCTSVTAFSGRRSATLFSARSHTVSFVCNGNGSRVQCMQVGSTLRASIREMWSVSSNLYGRHQRRDTRIRGAEDDFEVEDAVDYEMDGTGEDDEDEGDLRDYDTEYDMPMGDYTVQESETFMSTEGVEEERIVDYKIDEDEFHKLSLYDCDFFIRKVPDQDDDVFDFREMYVTAPDTDTYAIPKVIGEMPKKPLRCMKSNYEYVSVTEPPVDTPRAPLSKTEYQVMKVFLIKHYRNLRDDHEDFVLDFESIYVIDSATKSITKADVKVEVRRGKYRDRSAETLIVRDDGTTFKIIPSEEVHTPDEVIQALQWDRTKENMDNYLRGFRDYEKSKWF